jgi:acylphosphatase
MGLKGYVRNLPHGEVEVKAEGERKRLEELLPHLREGPPGAGVEGLEIMWSKYTGKLPRFEIRY